MSHPKPLPPTAGPSELLGDDQKVCKKCNTVRSMSMFPEGSDICWPCQQSVENESTNKPSVDMLNAFRL